MLALNIGGCLSKYDDIYTRTADYTRYMSADTAARREEFDQLITNRLKEIEENSELLRGLKRLSDECRCLKMGYKRDQKDTLYDYLQQELNVTFNMRDQVVRYKELGDVLFYYLMREEAPVGQIKLRIWKMGSDRFIYNNNHDWFRRCTNQLEITFTQFYKQLGNEPQHLEYLLYKCPQLLFNEFSFVLIRELNKHLPRGNLHQILLNTRDENGDTFLFPTPHSKGFPYRVWYRTARTFYYNKFDDLCELYSVRNKSGYTVLHKKALPYDLSDPYVLLLEKVTLNNQDTLNKLLSIIDDNNKTVCNTNSGFDKNLLTWVTRQHKHNNYPLYREPKVLIFYNTNDRPGAEKEAESIQQAFESVTSCVELKKMGTKREVLQWIAQTAYRGRDIFPMLIVCLMSHGNIGTIDDSEKNPITLTSIEGAMCSDHLKERPKILITQSCQARVVGIKPTHAEEATISNTDPGKYLVSNPPYEPKSDDFLSVQTCVSGEMSKRNVFIPYLAEEIINSSKTDNFVDLLSHVSDKMEREGYDQIPIVKPKQLRGKVCVKDGWDL